MLNDLTTLVDVRGEQTMSSRDIAELTGKRHDHILRDCDTLNDNYEKMGLPKLGEGYYTHPNTGNQQHREFRLTKIQTLDLMTGYRTDLRIKVNRRWAELEEEKMKREKEVKVIEPTEYDRELLQVRKLEANAKLLDALRATITNPIHKEILTSKFFSDDRISLPLPEVGEKSYSATELSKLILKKYGLNLSANKIGRIANEHNLKKPEFGVFLYDKSKYSDKTVESFHYYEKCVDEIVRLFRLENKKNNSKKHKQEFNDSIHF